MSRPRNRRPDPGGLSAEMILGLIGIGAVAAVVGACYLAVVVGSRIDGTAPPSSDNPFRIALGLVQGRIPWPRSGFAVIAGLAALLIMVGVGGRIGWVRQRRRRTRVDRSAGALGRGSEIDALSRRSVSAIAGRLGVADAIGVPVGRTVAGDRPVFGSWEDMHIDIWGPRTGKSTCRAIPAILDAPGAVLVTSNKRDVVDATRDVRAESSPVWVFDPQQIATEPPDWWWNPLSYVTNEVKAARMAQHFAAGSRDPGAKTDAFFDPAGQDLLAGLLLAAACDRRPITQVYSWVTRPTDETPVDILRDHNFGLIADQVSGVVTAPERQRGGIYGTAQQMATCLTNRQVARWISADPDDRRPQLEVADFVRRGGTLYSLSKEGKGTAGPLVTALTVAVVEAAEELASTSPGGRLSVPLLGVLDEAANVCRWTDLPDLYSHYGSRGIVLMTILQSWSQGVDVWGESGMKKLWSAANIKVYGGGVSEAQFLDDLSKIIGDYDRLSYSASVTKGQRTVSRQLQRERILDVSELASLPRGRAVVIASGARPTIVRTVPWMAGPQADAVRASISAHDPAGRPDADPVHPNPATDSGPMADRPILPAG